MPSFDKSGLGRIEYDTVSGSTASDLADPSPAKKKKERGNYTQYSPQQRASIGKYAFQNGNERARMHYLCEFPDLKESTIRNFKKAYQEKLHSNESNFILSLSQKFLLLKKVAHQCCSILMKS